MEETVVDELVEAHEVERLVDEARPRSVELVRQAAGAHDEHARVALPGADRAADRLAEARGRIDAAAAVGAGLARNPLTLALLAPMPSGPVPAVTVTSTRLY